MDIIWLHHHFVPLHVLLVPTTDEAVGFPRSFTIYLYDLSEVDLWAVALVKLYSTDGRKNKGSGIVAQDPTSCSPHQAPNHTSDFPCRF